MNVVRFLDAWQRTHAAFEPDAEWLGACGWTIPLWREPDVLRELRRMPVADVDAAFVRHYTVQRGANLKSVWGELLVSHGLAPWRVLLGQAVMAYRAGRYAIVVPALLAILDGAIAAGSQGVTKKSDPKSSAARKRRSTEKGMRRLIWASIEAFVQTVFRSAPFSGVRPSIVNRHWVLHGRDTSNWGRADCIRLFHALHTVMATIERVR